MRKIKTKSIVKNIKVLDKATDVSHRAKNAYIRTKEQAEQTQQTQHDNFVEYAEHKVKEGTETVTRGAGHAIEHQGKKIVQRNKERHNISTDTNYTDSADGYRGEQPSSPSETGNPQTAKSTVKEKQTASKARKTPEQYNAPIQAKQSAQQNATHSKTKEMAKQKYTLFKSNKLAKQMFIQKRAKAQLTKANQTIEGVVLRSNEKFKNTTGDTLKKSAYSVDKAVKQPAHSGDKAVMQSAHSSGKTAMQSAHSGSSKAIKQSAHSGGKAVKQTAKGTIKTSQKSFKTAGKTAKASIKTSKAAAIVTLKTTQATAKAAQRSAQAARAAVRLTTRMVRLAIKAAAVLVKGLAALVGTSSAVLVLLLIIITAAALISSPFGIFFSGENKDVEVAPISNVVQEVNDDFIARIENIKADYDNVDSVEIHYYGSTDNIRVDNWMDVVAVFAVKTAMDQEIGMDVATIDTTRIDFIKSVFWDMNLINYYVETIEHTETETVENEDGTTSEETTTTYEYILHINIVSKTADQQASEYDFTDDQKSIMKEILSSEFRPLMFTLLGMDGDIGLTAEQLQNLYNDLPVGVGGEAVKLALSRLGDPYSQPKAGQDYYTDCSYLVQWVYRQLDISLPRTAAAQAEYLVHYGLSISPVDLEPGDLIFFSHDTNGRYMNITHVAIYAGDGYIVDASSSKGQVAYRPLISGQVLYARPHVF